MEELLTVRKLQELLGVDRITIYRMLRDGRLRGVKVGGRWRFRRTDVQALLMPRVPAARASISSLPAGCVRALQLVLAEALGLSISILGPDGSLLGAVEGGCRYCQAIRRSSTGLGRCAASLASVATGSGRCHASLCCFAWPLELGGQPLGRLVACGYRRAEEEWRAQLGALSAQLGLAEDALEATAACVPVLGVAEEERLRRVLARAAEALGEMARERLAYQERLEEIRRMTEMS